jgi:ATP-dependent Lhr-like helicase
MVSERRGARLDFRVPPDHPRIGDYLGVLRSMVGRGERPVSAVEVETVNDEPAPSSPYRPAFEASFHVTRTPSSLRLNRRY